VQGIAAGRGLNGKGRARRARNERRAPNLCPCGTNSLNLMSVEAIAPEELECDRLYRKHLGFGRARVGVKGASRENAKNKGCWR
jgi:hypothetical protein